MEGENEFPLWALLPKKETGVHAFLNKHPEYDGRGIIIGIFDSGVDPGAPGMQMTSDGKPKVIGRYDCSGAGDVDTSTILKLDADGIIVGLSGRKLKIPKKWTNPSGEYHVGIKSCRELYPKMLRERMEKERREKLWDPALKLAQAQTVSSLTQHKASMEKVKEVPLNSRLQQEELDCRLEVIATLEKKFCDLGSVFDCVVFHDGNMWQVCIDTSEKGDLESGVLLGEYDKTLEFASLHAGDLVNCSVNVYEEGNLLEIVSFCSSHGTHVASIAAANFPDQPEKNGIAPGAQIISYTIGDSRIDTMETGTAMVRAMIKVMESQETDKPVKVINMSYGECSHWSSTGRVGSLMNEVVDKYGVCWVAAAGNNGPGLSTVNTPPDISTENLIGVGAYVSPDMMWAQYSLMSKAAGQPYTWTSRGPTSDGGKGVCICAPGGAITSVPQYTLCSSQLLNGTSMASPHVAGALCVLLSGLKEKNLSWTPYLVRRSLENTAQYQPSCDPFAQGHGLLQVEKAFEYLVTYSGHPDSRVRLQVSCGPEKNKGVYIRGGPSDKPKEFPVAIEPVFFNQQNIDVNERVQFEVRLALACDASWVSHPDHLSLTNMARTIQLRVDPTSLAPGVYNTSVRGYDSSCVDKGPIVRVEVTLVKPHVFDPSLSSAPTLSFSNVELKRSQIIRHFFLVPNQVSYAMLQVKNLDKHVNCSLVLHCIQLQTKQGCKTLETHKTLSIGPGAELTHCFQLKGGITCEVVLAKYWTEPWESHLDYSISLHGCWLEAESVVMHHAEGILAVPVRPGIAPEELHPTVTLKHNTLSLKPSESKVTVLGSRDIIPNCRHIYQLELTYQLHLHKLTEITPNSPLLSEYLYESEFESQIWMLYDCNKMLVAIGDAFPSKYAVKVEKGDYVLKHQVRHEKRELLEKFQDLTMMVSLKLPSPVSLDLYSSHAAAITSGKKLSNLKLPSWTFHHNTVPIFIPPINYEKYVKTVTPGQYLSGAFSLSKADLNKKIDTYKFKYILTELPKKSSNSNNKQAEKPKWEEMRDALKDLRISWLTKLEDRKESERLFEEVVKEFGASPAACLGLATAIEPDTTRVLPCDPRATSPETLLNAQQVLKLCNDALEMIDENELLVHLGTKVDHRPDAASIKTLMEKQKNYYVEALQKKGAAMCRLYLAQQDKSTKEESASSGGGDGPALPPITIDQIDAVWSTLLKIVDPSDSKNVGVFGMWHAASHGQWGRVARLAQRLSEDKPTRDLHDCFLAALSKLTWTPLADFLARSTLIRFPVGYRSF